MLTIRGQVTGIRKICTGRRDPHIPDGPTTVHRELTLVEITEKGGKKHLCGTLNSNGLSEGHRVLAFAHDQVTDTPQATYHALAEIRTQGAARGVARLTYGLRRRVRNGYNHLRGL